MSETYFMRVYIVDSLKYFEFLLFQNQNVKVYIDIFENKLEQKLDGTAKVREN